MKPTTAMILLIAGTFAALTVHDLAAMRCARCAECVRPFAIWPRLRCWQCWRAHRRAEAAKR